MHKPSALETRRRLLLSLLASAGGGALPGLALAQETDTPPRITPFPPESGYLRPMTVHQINELGLEIWTEAEPAWETGLLAGTPPTFTAQSPENYTPSAAITISAWRNERVPPHLLEIVAATAMRRAGLNYGLNQGQVRAMAVHPARWGILQGFETDFRGRAQGMAMDVKVFVGQGEGKYPVVGQIYTQAGKMQSLQEVIRRCWSNITYLQG